MPCPKAALTCGPRDRHGRRPPATPDLRACIEVCDTGVGMDEETRRRCLEPFFTTKGERGTGLGLAMVYGMVQRHSADIEIDSAPGEGTTVRLSVRACPTPAAPARRSRSRAPAAPARCASCWWTTTRCCSSPCATP